MLSFSSSSPKDEPDLLRDPLKACKILIFFPTQKFADVFPTPMKLPLAVFASAIVTLLVIVTVSFSSHLLSCSQCVGRDPFLPLAAVTSNTAVESPTNISHIMFGIGGSAKTWHKRRHYSEIWWRPNITRGFIWLEEDPTPFLKGHTWPEKSPPYKVSGDTSKFKYSCWYGSRSAVRIARIVKESFDLGHDNVRWFVMGDDDTVFFAENLLEVLRKYDHNQMYYIGGNSESAEQAQVHSYAMAYGGGGFAISRPLAAELVRVLDGCINRYASMYGSDQKVQACLSEIGVPLTKELGFHQMDIRGNPYGFLASHPLTPLVSLHHLDYFNPLFPNLDRINSLKKLTSAYQLDPSRTLQRSFCHDPIKNFSVSIAWGYTLQVYASLLTAKELDTTLLTFQTWRWGNEPFTFDTRAMSAIPCDRPLVYFLDSVRTADGDHTVTSYKRHEKGEGEECKKPEYINARKIDRFNVSAPRFDPSLWVKAPRRHCCEVIHGGDVAETVVQINVRGCRPSESVTPP